MTTTIFDTSIQKTKELLSTIEAEPYVKDEDHALEILRAVLTTLRDRLTVEQANSVGAQLTPLLRGIFYEGWAAGSVPVKMDRSAFLTAVEDRLSEPVDASTEEIVEDVLSALGAAIEPSELVKLKEEALPADVGELVPA